MNYFKGFAVAVAMTMAMALTVNGQDTINVVTMQDAKGDEEMSKEDVIEELNRHKDEKVQDIRFVFKKSVSGWDNQNFAFCFWDGKSVYNLRSYPYNDFNNVVNAKVSPASFAFVAMMENKGKRRLGLYSTSLMKCYQRFKFKNSGKIVDYAFTSDAKRLAVIFANRQMLMVNLSDYSHERTINLQFMPERWKISSNNYFLAMTRENSVYVYNMETEAKRAVVRCKGKVNDVAFSADNMRMGVTSDEGKLYIYDTRTFTLQKTVDGLRQARECYFHPDEKYVSVITGDKEITIVNLKDAENDRIKIDGNSGYVNHIGGAKSLDGVAYLLYNSGTTMHFYRMSHLVPNYGKIVTDMANRELREWQKQMRGESTDEYRRRVNEQTRVQKFAELKGDIATELAGNMANEAEKTVGEYDKKKRLLEIKFDKLPPIYLGVKKDEVEQLNDATDLIFENSRYGVDEKDHFELLYTEVVNRKTGKRFVYEKGKENDFAVEEEDDNFVPMDIIRQTSEDEAKLEEIKDSIVHEVMSMNLISDKTHVSVKTNVEPSVNADGQKTINYSIDFNYFVELDYSTRDDYKMGQYECEYSQAAMAMLKCVTQAFAEHFESYLKSGKKVVITLSGSADATPINRAIKYDGRYGNFENSLVYDKGELGTITVTKEEGIKTNEQLAFMRAVSVRNYVDANIEKLKEMQRDYIYNISVSSESGAEYRRIGVTFTFIDTFGR